MAASMALGLALEFFGINTFKMLFWSAATAALMAAAGVAMFVT